MLFLCFRGQFHWMTMMMNRHRHRPRRHRQHRKRAKRNCEGSRLKKPGKFCSSTTTQSVNCLVKQLLLLRNLSSLIYAPSSIARVCQFFPFPSCIFCIFHEIKILPEQFWIELGIPYGIQRVGHVKPTPVQTQLQHLGASFHRAALDKELRGLGLTSGNFKEEISKGTCNSLSSNTFTPLPMWIEPPVKH